MKSYLFFALVFTCLSISLNAFAQSAEVAVGGDVGNPFKITKANFASLKHISIKAKSKDGKEHEYSGVNLYDIITKAESIPGNILRGKYLTKYILVSAADGYQIVIAIPEIYPDFTNNTIILANKMDGKDLPDNAGPFRLIVPLDKKQARSATQVISIDVLTAEKP